MALAQRHHIATVAIAKWHTVFSEIKSYHLDLYAQIDVFIHFTLETQWMFPEVTKGLYGER